MGQIFHACVYDIETRTCSVIDADKFHANCYAHSGAVFSTHYLLRQKPYRVMWGGGYVAIDNNLDCFSRNEDLLGISTYKNFESFDSESNDFDSKDYDKIKFIGDNNKSWNMIDVWDEAEKYFDWEKNRSVSYNGYLLNHTQKLAVDLADYHKRSITFIQGCRKISK